MFPHELGYQVTGTQAQNHDGPEGHASSTEG